MISPSLKISAAELLSLPYKGKMQLADYPLQFWGHLWMRRNGFFFGWRKQNSSLSWSRLCCSSSGPLCLTSSQVAEEAPGHPIADASMKTGLAENSEEDQKSLTTCCESLRMLGEKTLRPQETTMTLEDNATATRRDIRTVFEASHVRIFHNKLVNNWYKCRAPHPPMVRMLSDASGFECITANPSITRR